MEAGAAAGQVLGADGLVPRVVLLRLLDRFRRIQSVAIILGHIARSIGLHRRNGITDPLERQTGAVSNWRGCGRCAGTQHEQRRYRARQFQRQHWPSPRS